MYNQRTGTQLSYAHKEALYSLETKFIRDESYQKRYLSNSRSFQCETKAEYLAYQFILRNPSKDYTTPYKLHKHISTIASVSKQFIHRLFHYLLSTPFLPTIDPSGKKFIPTVPKKFALTEKRRKHILALGTAVSYRTSFPQLPTSVTKKSPTYQLFQQSGIISIVGDNIREHKKLISYYAAITGRPYFPIETTNNFYYSISHPNYPNLSTISRTLLTAASSSRSIIHIPQNTHFLDTSTKSYIHALLQNITYVHVNNTQIWLNNRTVIIESLTPNQWEQRLLETKQDTIEHNVIYI